MRCKSALAIAIAFILFLVVSVNMSQETLVYSIKAGDYTMEFIPSPELGYVVKSSGNVPALQYLSDSISATQGDNKEYLGISDRDDMVVVMGKESSVANKNNINLLSHQSGTDYVAPLFILQGQTVAVMPEIIVRLNNAKNYDALNDFCAQFNCTISHKLLYTETEYSISTAAKDAEEVFSLAEIFNLADFIKWASPSVAFQPRKFNESSIEYQGVTEPDDTYFDQQWHLDMIRAPEAWGYTTGDPNIIVAVIDDGVQIAHPDLADNIWTNPGEIPGNGIDDDGNFRIDDIHGWNFYFNTNNVNPTVSTDGHGTACAGLIAAKGNNNLGVTGVAWNCTILPVKISHADNFKTEENIASSIRYAAISGADVISNSWGTIGEMPVVHSAIKDVTRKNGIGRDGKGCVILFSSGNWANGGEVVYPAKYSEVISIGAIDESYTVWYYSGSGPELDFVTPSGAAGSDGNVWTTDLIGASGYNNRNSDIKDYTDKMGGTSGSCPIAAGVAALILSVDPNLTNVEVKSIMVDSVLDLGDSGWDESYGHGCLDAYEAISLALNPRKLTIYVDANAPSDPGPGNPDISDSLEDGSKEHPFDTIQEAINFSMFRDTIKVMPGTYSGQGNRDIDFMGKVITLKSQDGAESCIIDCQSQNRAFTFDKGEGESSVIDGFTIRDGNATQGGGISVYNSSPTIMNCVFSGNEAGNGGGISISKGDALIKDCIFINNVSEMRGGGLYITDSSLVLNNCTFEKNESNTGGGLYSMLVNSMVFNNCTFKENVAQSKGGGVFTNNIINMNDCAFNENMAESKGGGVFTNDIINMNDCAFTGNSTNSEGGGIYFQEGSNSILNNCSFTENKASQGGGFVNFKCDLTLNSCTFIKNSAKGDGGGGKIFYGDNSVLSNCTFTENQANAGGGLYSYGSDVQLHNCAFNQNTSNKGGGMYTYSKHPTVESCKFIGNSAVLYGGGINTSGSQLKMTNCILVDNTAYSGGGLYGESYSYDIKNCTFYGNTGGIYQSSGGCRIYSCILWNNGQDLGGNVYTYNCWVQTAWMDPKLGLRTPNSGEPLFADPANGDFHLQSQAGRWDPQSKTWIKDNVTSPCIDAGYASQYYEKEVWPHGDRVNIGAYGGSTQASLSLSNTGDKRNFDNNTYISWDDILLFTQDWGSNDLPLKGDFDFNGKVDMDDLLVFYGNWKSGQVNDMPEFQTINNQNVKAGQLLTFSVSASDNNGDALNYAALGLPENAEFSEQVFSWTPQKSGTYSIVLIVSDNKSLNYKTMQIVVHN